MFFAISPKISRKLRYFGISFQKSFNSLISKNVNISRKITIFWVLFQNIYMGYIFKNISICKKTKNKKLFSVISSKRSTFGNRLALESLSKKRFFGHITENIQTARKISLYLESLIFPNILIGRLLGRLWKSPISPKILFFAM